MMIAERLGMTLSEAQSKISSSEFTLWKAYISTEHERFHREDFLFAMVAAEIRRTAVKKPNKVELKHFLLDFGNKKKKKPKAQSKEAAEMSKTLWLSAVGLNPEEI